MTTSDGGVTALGANFVNMGLIGSLGGYAIYAPIRRVIGGRSGVLVGSMVAAWFAVILASGAFSLELASSGRWADFLSVLGWMTLVHAGIGLGEALITGLVLRFVLLTRPDLIHDAEAAPTSRPVRWGQVLVAGLGIALAVAIILAPFASEYEDGLEWAGGKLGLLEVGGPVHSAPIPEYQLALPGLSHVKVATSLAGAVGTLVVFVVGFGLARVFTREEPARASDNRPEDREESQRSW
jgi:cobalt/nickel transport system permease protein